MKLKNTLAAVTAMLTVGVFYTFAFCIVEDVEENEISAEYYYYTETDITEPVKPLSEAGSELLKPAETTAAVAETEDFVTETEPTGEPETEKSSEDERNGDYGEVTDRTAVTEVPEDKEELPEPETVSAETEPAEEDYPEDFDVDELDDGSTEALEQEVYGGYGLDGGEDIDASAETEPYETEVPEVTFTEETAFTYDESDEIVITLFEGVSDFYPEENTETSVSVNVANGGDTSTSETFTVKINGKAQTVNAYDVICQIVANEMSPSFSDEAIKAQAVAAYSYVKYHNVNGLTPSVLVKKNPSNRIKELVSEVWGVCCYYNGSVAQTVYMASSSGYTADAKNVWGGSVPYLKSVYCPFDSDSDPNYGDTMEVSEDSMRNMLESSLGINLSNNPYDWLVIKGYVDGNYVSDISVDGQKTISGRKLRENVMGHKLKSAAFDVYYSDGYFHFTTYGYGHGVGMSQNGANILAKQGYSYVDILKFYFTGIEVI